MSLSNTVVPGLGDLSDSRVRTRDRFALDLLYSAPRRTVGL
jgi:hypothetical protein